SSSVRRTANLSVASDVMRFHAESRLYPVRPCTASVATRYPSSTAAGPRTAAGRIQGSLAAPGRASLLRAPLLSTLKLRDPMPSFRPNESETDQAIERKPLASVVVSM